MEYKTTKKYVLTSPRKLREVVHAIKVLKPEVALEVLPNLNKRAAGVLGKVLQNAVANAENQGASRSELVFKEIQIGEGTRLKRFRAGSRGRAKPYAKRMSNIRIVLRTIPKPKIKDEKSKLAGKDNEEK